MLWVTYIRLYTMLSKKKLTDIFLRKDDRQAPDSDIPFDENFFDLHSDFNGTNYSLISISATILKGAKANEKLNLRCKWFLKTLDDFKEIAEIKGTYYQPCVEDIGSMYRVSVQIEPSMEDKEYEGITLVKEFGPIKIDQRLKSFQASLGNIGQLTVNIKLENIYSSSEEYSEFQFPLEATITFLEGGIQLDNNGKNIVKADFKDNVSTMEVIRKTFNSLILTVGDSSFRLTAESNVKRDELMITFKTFSMRSSGQEAEMPLSCFLKVDQLLRGNEALKKELELMSIERTHALTSSIQLKEMNENLRVRLDDYENILKENEELKTCNLKLKSQSHFYINETSIYKMNIKEKQTLIDHLTSEVSSAHSRLQRMDFERSQHSGKYQEQLSEVKLEKQGLERDLVKERESNQEMEMDLQEKSEQINILLRKCEDIKEDKHNLNEAIVRAGNVDTQLEVQGLKNQIFNLESILSKYKADEKANRSLWDVKSLLAGLKSTKTAGQATVYLQKLVSSLTETVTEKEMQLSNQRQTNKLLNKELQKYKSKYPSVEDESSD